MPFILCYNLANFLSLNWSMNSQNYNPQDSHLIYAGGTFGCHGTPLAPLSADVFLPVLSTLLNDRLTNNQHILANDIIKDSSCLTPSDFVEFYRLITTAYQHGVRRFVLITGTDSLSFLAAFLANALMNISDMSLIITGSMKPLLNPSQTPYVIDDDSDAWHNISQAVHDSQHQTGVWIRFFEQSLPAENSQKIHSQNADAFIGGTPSFAKTALTTPNINTLQARAKSAHIDSIYLLPNDPQSLADKLCQSSAVAVILIGFGAGNVPYSDNTATALDNLHKQGVAVVCSTMCPFGGVSDAYQAGAWQYDHHVWSGGQLSIAGIYGRLLWLYLSDNLTKSQWENYD